MRFIDGGRMRIHFFASRLKYSRWVEVTSVPDFAALGGVPLLSVFDRPKTVVLHWKKDGTVRSGTQRLPR